MICLLHVDPRDLIFGLKALNLRSQLEVVEEIVKKAVLDYQTSWGMLGCTTFMLMKGVRHVFVHMGQEDLRAQGSLTTWPYCLHHCDAQHLEGIESIDFKVGHVYVTFLALGFVDRCLPLKYLNPSKLGLVSLSMCWGGFLIHDFWLRNSYC